MKKSPKSGAYPTSYPQKPTKLFHVKPKTRLILDILRKRHTGKWNGMEPLQKTGNNHFSNHQVQPLCNHSETGAQSKVEGVFR